MGQQRRPPRESDGDDDAPYVEATMTRETGEMHS